MHCDILVISPTPIILSNSLNFMSVLGGGVCRVCGTAECVCVTCLQLVIYIQAVIGKASGNKVTKQLLLYRVDSTVPSILNINAKLTSCLICIICL